MKPLIQEVITTHMNYIATLLKMLQKRGVPYTEEEECAHKEYNEKMKSLITKLMEVEHV